MADTAGTDSISPRSGQEDRPRKDRIELVVAVLIGVAAVLTAVAVFQGGKVDGDIDRQQTAALRLTLAANDAFNAADAQQAIERDWIFGWITEAINGTAAADYLKTAMPDSVFALADEWMNADDDITDPFSEEAADVYSSYDALPSVGLLISGDELDAEAECAIFLTQVLGVQGDSFGLSTVFLAISLVTGGIAALLRRRLAQNIVLVTAVASLVIGAGLLLLGTAEADARREVAPDFYPTVLDQPATADQAIALADELCPSG